MASTLIRLQVESEEHNPGPNAAKAGAGPTTPALGPGSARPGPARSRPPASSRGPGRGRGDLRGPLPCKPPLPIRQGPLIELLEPIDNLKCLSYASKRINLVRVVSLDYHNLLKVVVQQ